MMVDGSKLRSTIFLGADYISDRSSVFYSIKNCYSTRDRSHHSHKKAVVFLIPSSIYLLTQKNTINNLSISLYIFPPILDQLE